MSKQMFDQMSDRQIQECFNATVNSKKSKIFAARSLSKWFELDLSIKIFGVEIVHFHFPPMEKNDNDVVSESI